MSVEDKSPSVKLQGPDDAPDEEEADQTAASRTEVSAGRASATTLELAAGEAQQALGPDELDRPDGQAGQDDEPAGSGERDQDDADGDHDPAEQADHQLEGQPSGPGRPDPLSETPQLFSEPHASLQPLGARYRSETAYDAPATPATDTPIAEPPRGRKRLEPRRQLV